MHTNQITSRIADWETIALALVLMITGFILLGGDLFGVLSLDRIQNLWPVALILTGVIDLFSQPETLQRDR
jgi:hypothetical protein